MRRPSMFEVIERLAHRRDTAGRMLAADQAAALAMVAVSGRTLDVLVGPAGAGKTTAMNALRRAWQSQHGEGSVIGLAPSAAAAQVLAEELGIVTENTAMWITRHSHGHTGFRCRPVGDRGRGIPGRDVHPRHDHRPRRRGGREGSAGRGLGATRRRGCRRDFRDARARPRRRPRAGRHPQVPQRVGEDRLPATAHRRPGRHRHLPGAGADSRRRGRGHAGCRLHRMAGTISTTGWPR